MMAVTIPVSHLSDACILYRPLTLPEEYIEYFIAQIARYRCFG